MFETKFTEFVLTPNVGCDIINNINYGLSNLPTNLIAFKSQHENYIVQQVYLFKSLSPTNLMN